MALACSCALEHLMDMVMKLWIVQVREIPPFCRGHYEEHVVAAFTEEAARALAASVAAGEGADTWLDPKKSVCDEIVAGTVERIILSSVVAG